MPHQIQIEKALSTRTEYGAVQYGAATTYRAYVEGRIRTVRTLQGEDKISSVTVYVGAAPGIVPEDRLTLPVGWTPRQPVILSVSRQSDQAGLHHEVVYAA